MKIEERESFHQMIKHSVIKDVPTFSLRRQDQEPVCIWLVISVEDRLTGCPFAWDGNLFRPISTWTVALCNYRCAFVVTELTWFVSPCVTSLLTFITLCTLNIHTLTSFCWLNSSPTGAAMWGEDGREEWKGIQLRLIAFVTRLSAHIQNMLVY